MFRESLDDFYDILFNYQKGLSRIALNRNIWHGMIIYLFVNLIVSLATFHSVVTVEQGVLLLPGIYPFVTPESLAGVLHFMPLAKILVQLVFGPIYFLFVVGVVNLVAELFGGKGKILKLGAVIGYGHYPFLIVALGGLFARYTDFNLIAFLAFIALLWSLFIKIAGLKTVYDFSWGQAALIYFMPVLTLIAAFILFLLLAIVFLFPLIMQFAEILHRSFVF